MSLDPLSRDSSVMVASPHPSAVDTEFQAAIDKLIRLAAHGDHLDALRRLDAITRTVEAAQIRLVAKIDRRGETIADSGLQTATWMSNELKCPRGKSASLVRTARKLDRRFNLLADAVRGGVITVDHAHAVVAVSNRRIEPHLVDLQPRLIDLAVASTFTEFQRDLRSLANLLDEDGADPESERVRSALRITRTPEGISLNGQLVGSLAATVADALNLTADRAYKDAAATGEEPPARPQLLASALVDICRRGVERPTTGPASVEISLIVEADTPESARTAEETRVADGTLDMFKCDAVWRVITFNAAGKPLDVGRAQRLATEAQRRALRLRDRRCVFPGCGAPIDWTEVHHVHPWNEGGPTNIDQLVCLCRRHHGLVHSKGWSMDRRDDNTWCFTTPTGVELTTDRLPKPSSWSTTRRPYWQQQHHPPPPRAPLHTGGRTP